MYLNEFANCYAVAESMVTLARFYFLLKHHRKLFKKSPHCRPRKHFVIFDTDEISSDKLCLYDAGGFNHQVCSECTRYEREAAKYLDKTCSSYREVTAEHALHYEKAVNNCVCMSRVRPFCFTSLYYYRSGLCTTFAAMWLKLVHIQKLWQN